MTSRSTKSRAELNASAIALAHQHQLVKHHGQLFIPLQWDDQQVSDQLPEPLETVWQPLKTEDILDFGNQRGLILFQNEGEFRSFMFMLKQEARKSTSAHTDSLLIKTPMGLRLLNAAGELVEPTGEFVPNVLSPTLNMDEELKSFILNTISEWLMDEAPAHSLLHHLATTLAPSWSAAKMVLLLGEGRNGKSTLLKMLKKLLGEHNVSHVTRQQMSAREPAIIDLNNKLANIVFDAAATFLADSSTEKTLVVGETVGVRLLYENANTAVSTNGLFIEGQNQEPKSRDKTNALQRRLVRFWFPREYPLDSEFEKRMLSDEMLGAFLSLLLDHFVTEEERASKLVPSQASYDLQVEQQWANSKTFQYLYELARKDTEIFTKIKGMLADDLASQFHAWLMGGKDDYSMIDAYRMLKECFVLKRKSVRSGGKITKAYVVDALTDDAQRMIDKLTEEGEEDESGVLDEEALVDD